MDAPCKIQGSIHVCLIRHSMCPENWVHITGGFFLIYDFKICTIARPPAFCYTIAVRRCKQWHDLSKIFITVTSIRRREAQGKIKRFKRKWLHWQRPKNSLQTPCRMSKPRLRCVYFNRNTV